MAQEALLKVFENADQLRDAEHVRAWVFRIARNACLMKRRKSVFAPEQELSLEQFFPRDGAGRRTSPSGNRRLVASAGERPLAPGIEAKLSVRRSASCRRNIARWCCCEMWRSCRQRRPHRSWISARMWSKPGCTVEGWPFGRSWTTTCAHMEHNPESCKEVFELLSQYLDLELPPEACQGNRKSSGRMPALRGVCREPAPNRGALSRVRTRRDARAAESSRREANCSGRGRKCWRRAVRAGNSGDS